MRHAHRARDVLRDIPIADLLQMIKKAADLYTQAELPLGDGTQTPDQFVRMQSATTGLPEHMCKFNMEKNQFVLNEMERILDSLTRGLDLNVLTRGYGVEARGVPMSYQAQSPVLGMVLLGSGTMANGIAEVAAKAGYSVVLRARTAFEPGPPQAIDMDHDELAFYPLLYWPVVADHPRPSQAAIRNLDVCVRLDPVYYAAVVNLGEAYLEKNDPATARGYLDRALALRPAGSEALVDIEAVTTQRERMAVGACVNLAARLQSAARPGQLVVAADLCPGLDRLLPGGLADAVELRGREAPVEVLVAQA